MKSLMSSRVDAKILSELDSQLRHIKSLISKYHIANEILQQDADDGLLVNANLQPQT